MGVLKYYEYPILLMLITLVGCAVSASLQHAQQLRLKTVACQTRLVPFVCKGYIRAMWARLLVPGDVIVVQPGAAVCDMVLLQGNALVQESRLTGRVRPPLCGFTQHLYQLCIASISASCSLQLCWPGVAATFCSPLHAKGTMEGSNAVWPYCSAGRTRL